MADVQDLRGKVAIEGADKAASDLKKVHKSTSDLAEGFKGAISTLTGFLAGIGIADLASKALGYVTDHIGEWVKGAQDAQAAQAETNRILSSGSHILGLTSDQINQVSQQYMDLTGVDDDVIHGAANIIAGYNQISKQVFPDVIKASLDLAQAQSQATGKQVSATDTAKVLGQALQDPTRAARLLRSENIILSDAQKKAIDTAMKHHDVAKAQAIIMDAVKQKVDGAAEAFAGTNAGKIQKFQTTIDNIGKTIAGAVLPVLTDLLDAVTPLVQQFAANLPGAIEQAKTFLTNLGKALGPVAGAVKDFVVNAWSKIQAAFKDPAQQKQLSNLGTILHNLGDAFQKAWPGIKQFAETVGKNLIEAFKNAWPKIEQARKAFADFTSAVIERLQPIIAEWWPKLQKGIEDVVAIWDWAWPGIQATFQTVWGVIQGVVTIAWNIISGIIKIGLDILGGNWKGAWHDMQKMFEGVWKGIQQIGQSLFGKLRDFIVSKAIEIKDNVVAKFNELKTNAQNKLGELKDNALKTIGELPGKLKDLGTQMIQRLIDGIQGMAGTLGNTVHNIIKNAFSNLPGGIHVPGFASGTMDAPGGLAYVHRDELVYLPQHSQVYTAAQTRDILGALGLGHAAQARTSTASTINVYPQQAVLDTAELARIQHRRDLLNGVRG